MWLFDVVIVPHYVAFNLHDVLQKLAISFLIEVGRERLYI
jgi:hypothetical protein